jgi:hypothetical protein
MFTRISMRIRMASCVIYRVILSLFKRECGRYFDILLLFS